jgi:uroporphyrin-III C-methyltransferase / precorrin-2 dehydrogenase / sirohydrochlorin ferrochelatase
VEDGADPIVARLKARGILVNAVDRPDLCDFTLPSILDRDPVLIAIGTGGASAGLAKAVRQRLELLLPQSLGHLAESLRDARTAIRKRWGDAAGRRRGIDAALADGGPLDPFKPFSPAMLTAWLAAPDAAPPVGLKTFLIDSDDADALTIAQARLLGQADTIIHSPQIAPAILARARADAVRVVGNVLPDPLPPGLTVHLVRGDTP